MPGNPLTDPSWAADVTDTIERMVGKVRDNVTVKAVTVVRALVFGLIISIAAIAALALLIVVGTKLLQGLVRFPTRTDHASSVWISYLVMSGLLFLGGAVCMRKRFSGEDTDK
ncbi:MAG: hypothetical protein ABIR68_14745 [Ilumatobacteraceae bacterium]